MEESLPLYNEIDLRSLSNVENPICAIDGYVYDLTVLLENTPSIKGFAGYNLNELCELSPDIDPQIQGIREQINQLRVPPVATFSSLRTWEYQPQAQAIESSDMQQCPFAHSSTEKRCPFAREPPQPDHSDLPVMTTQELSVHNGSTPGMPRLIALNGLVYNVTSDTRSFGPGAPLEHLIGTDATDELLLKLPEEHRNALSQVFQTHYHVIGRLIDEPST